MTVQSLTFVLIVGVHYRYLWVATHLEHLENSKNLKVVREKYREGVEIWKSQGNDFARDTMVYSNEKQFCLTTA